MRERLPIALTVALMAGVLVVVVVAQVRPVDLPQDKGPADLDVSAYPAAIQSDFKVVKSHCGECHPMGRALNTTMPSDYWAQYLGELSEKQGISLTPEEATAIADFLIYDQVHRKDLNPARFTTPHTEEEIGRIRQAQTKKST